MLVNIFYILMRKRLSAFVTPGTGPFLVMTKTRV